MTTPQKKTTPLIVWFFAVSLVLLVATVIGAGIISGELSLTTTLTLLMVPVGTIVAAVVVAIGGNKDE